MTRDGKGKAGWIAALIGCGCLGIGAVVCGIGGWVLYEQGAFAGADAELEQAAFVEGSTRYRFGYESIPTIPVDGAPQDTDYSRWAMLHDGRTYRLFFMRRGARDTLYQFGFDRAKGAYVHGLAPMRGSVRIEGIPADADTSSFAMLHDGDDYRLYFRAMTGSRLLQFAFDEATGSYEYGYRSIEEIPVEGSPADTDWGRWAMLHDGESFRLYTGRRGATDELYQHAFDRGASEYRYAFRSIPRMTLEAVPPDSDESSFAMLHDETHYRFYYLGDDP